MSNKVALITGAARGLGLTIAEALAERGYAIAGVDLRGDALAAELAKLAATTGVETLALTADVGDEAQAEAAVETCLERFGRIDVFVSNAGVREPAPIWSLSTQTWRRTLATNLDAAFWLTRAVLTRDMLARASGTLIYISSDAGKAGSRHGSAYAASKWGLLGFAASVAKDLGDTDIRVTSIVPGMTETPMARESEAWDRGYDWLDPAHVARAVVYCVEQDPSVHIPELVIHHRRYV